MKKKLTLILCGLFILVLIAAGAGYFYFIRLPMPTVSGQLRINGLKGPVTVYRDRWSVPHIYAGCEHDLFMAQGFVQAQDRLWQMEINRRLAAGRLSEVFGAEALEVDKLVRSIGLFRAACDEIAVYDPSELALLQAFSAGVNAFLESHKNRLPLEFRILKIHPEPWKPEDSIGWSKFMAYMGGKNWQEEIVRALLVKEVGEYKAHDLLKRISPRAEPIPERIESVFLQPFRPAPGRAFLPAFAAASNNWVVHGSRTTTGHPLLANDMHLTLTVPSVLYEVHLSGGDLDVIGLSLPGLPLVIAGHNRSLAWGITFAYTDVEDLFLERFDHEGKYLFRDEWLEPRHVREEIRVKDRKEPVILDVQVTRHGPVVSPLMLEAEELEHALALKWSGHEPGHAMSALYRMNRAQNWDEFKAAAIDWSEPAVNLVYADEGGNIGFVLGSRVPLRSQAHGMGPFTGWTGESEWTGYLAADQKPYLLNPDPGYFATANNDVVGPQFPYYLAVDYASDNRAKRIGQVLSEKKPISKEDFRNLQGDFTSLSARSFLDSVQGIEVDDPEALALLKILHSWDGQMAPDSAGAAIYAVLIQRLLENTFRDELGPLTEPFLGVGLIDIDPINRFAEHSRTILASLMLEPDSPWFDDIDTPDKEELPEILEKSLLETASFLKEKLGPDSSAWRWGQLHTVEMKHFLGRGNVLGSLLNLGPYEGGGNFSTVWQSSVMPGMDFSLRGWSAANRHIYDLQDWDASLGMIVPGQSGIPRSPHYDDQVDLWLQVRHHPLSFTRARVESEAASRLVLQPAEREP